MTVREAGQGGADPGGYAGARAGAYAEGYSARYAGDYTGGRPGGTGGDHAGGCACGDCPHGAREGHRRAVAAFLRRRDEFAAGQGLPAAVAHSASASRQYVSEELAQSAEHVAERGRAEGQAWLTGLWRRTAAVVWATVVLLLLGQALTAVGAGWTAARTAGLAAALLTALSLTAASWFHRTKGGVLAPVIGEDNRLSTSRTVAAAWVLFVAYSVLVLAGRLAAASRQRDRDALISGLDLARGAGIVTVLAVLCGIAVLVRRVVGLRVLGQRLQKVRADRPRAADLLTDDAGRGTFADIQYVVISGVALVFAAVRLARMVVRVGAVHVHVPLVPVPGGFRNPTDTLLTVPVPADVEPGRVEVQVVTAAGVDTNRYAVDVTE